MNKHIFNCTIIAAMLLLGACSKKLDLTPVSNLSNESYWKTPDQFDAFVTGMHSAFRNNTGAFQLLGEMRADIFGTETALGPSFTGEASQGLERMWLQTLDLDGPGVANFGDFYFNINQINLLISKLNSTNIVTPANRRYYLGTAYGMRAFYYFQLLRTWGKVVIQTEPVTSIDVSALAKAASSAEEVMKLVKSDIDSSVINYGADYTFRNSKGSWSKAATLMLKAEVYLWTSHRGGGAGDATIAKNALADIQANAAGLALLPKFADVFSVAGKGNNEIIFAVRYKLNEANMGFVSSSFVPQTGLIANFYDSVGNRQFNVTTDNWGGLLRAPVRIATFRQYDDRDSRKWVSIQPAYTKDAAGAYRIAGAFARKYEGEQNAGARQYTNDFPIYRYADLLLLLAEAKLILGEDPGNEINLVRARAYGAAYSDALAYPNQAVDGNPKEALLKERLLEFVFEGKRWYDLRRMGDNYVYAHTALEPAEAYKLLWPIDRGSLTNNRELEQNPGYPRF